MKYTLQLSLLVYVLGSLASHGSVRLSNLFSDGVVLQQNRPVTIWGWADPGESIDVEFGGVKTAARADASGKWIAKLEPLPASAEPRSLTVRGKNLITIRNVVVGEVWLASGQSNMALRLAELESARKEIRTANDSLLRMFCVPERPGERPWEDVTGEWMSWSGQTGARFSAIGYYFGRRLRQELGSPVGIVLCAWGGSGVSSWMSPEALRSFTCQGLWPEDVLGWRPNIQPSRLYNGMLHPLIPFSVAGVIWYQGETEGDPSQNPYIYRYLFQGMINDWRTQWQNPELPFFYVQLPNLRNKPTWPVVRESQAKALQLPHTGMIPTIDIGREAELHPINKSDFADRLANLVLARQYQKPIGADSPQFSNAHFEPGLAKIRFQHTGGGLRTSDGQKPRGFEIAADNGEFVAAEAAVAGSDVILRSEAVNTPVMVRYAWKDTPKVNLVNQFGLPVVPFRTDSLPVAGQEMMPHELQRKANLAAKVTGSDLVLGRSTWQASTHAADPTALKAAGVVRGDPKGTCPLVIRDRPVRQFPASPELNWTLTGPFESRTGFTVEVRLLPYRMAHALRGFDIEVGLRHEDAGLKRYLLTILPMRMHAIQRNEVRVLGSNLDNCTASHTYRIAIRPDGVAQVYFDNELKGTLAGELKEGNAAQDKSFIMVGKNTSEGEWVANLDYVAFEKGGAFAP